MITYKNLGRNGALGNQLWEIAGTLGVAYQRKDRPSFPAWDYQPYFSIPDDFFDNQDGHDLGLDFLQELHWWKDIKYIILDFFEPPDEIHYDIMNQYREFYSGNRVTAIQVRRANNIYLPDHHPVPTLDYFEKAMDLMRHKTDAFLLFSDEPDWCRQQSLFRDCVYAEGNDPSIDIMQLTNGTPLSLPSAAFDMHVMSYCDNAIISNSSYGWWGAYKGKLKGVIRPARWYGPALAHIDVDAMMPESWVAIDA